VVQIVIEVPEKLKTLREPIVRFLEAAARQVRAGERGRQGDYAEFEGEIRERAGAMELAAHAAALAALDPGTRKILVNGEEYTQVTRSPGMYFTQVGEVQVTRSLYRRVGERNGKTLDPIAARVGAVDGAWLPATAEAMAFLVQQQPSREVAQAQRRVGRLSYSRSAFEDVGHRVGELVVKSHISMEHELTKSFEVPMEVTGVSVGLDRVSMPMEEPRELPPGPPPKDAPKRPIARVFRMAYCGCVTLHDAEGKAVHTIRYGCMPGGDEHTLAMGLADDALMLRKQRPDLTITLNADGAAEMWNLLEDEFDRATFGRVYCLLDFWHLIEKLSAAAKVIHGKASAPVVARWKLRLLNSNKAADEILRELETSGKEFVRAGEEEPVHAAMTYITNNRDRMSYSTARRKGLPIGSGNVEATCKTLVETRMKRAGSRWKNSSGEHILQLRCLAISDRWSSAMRILLTPPTVRIRSVA